MQLTNKQVEIIQEWAATTRLRPRGRLFGSRAKGSPKPTSDIDLAITVDGNTAGTILGNWYVEGKRWQPQLTPFLGSKAYLDLYDDPDGDKALLRRI
jgi:predicted nucleotidyltransferase